MLANGKYSVWFKARQGEGLGVISLTDGRVIGGDAMVSYAGTMIQTGDDFVVSIKTKRCAPGRLPLFQIDELDIELTGTSVGPIAHASGSVKQVPDTFFDVILLPVVEDAAGDAVQDKVEPAPLPKFDASRLPRFAATRR